MCVCWSADEQAGIDRFFQRHRCNSLCRQAKLPDRSGAILEGDEEEG